MLLATTILAIIAIFVALPSAIDSTYSIKDRKEGLMRQLREKSGNAEKRSRSPGDCSHDSETVEYERFREMRLLGLPFYRKSVGMKKSRTAMRPFEKDNGADAPLFDPED